jgi:hypothetical protein
LQGLHTRGVENLNLLRIERLGDASPRRKQGGYQIAVAQLDPLWLSARAGTETDRSDNIFVSPI